jgi:hypothetical protein
MCLQGQRTRSSRWSHDHPGRPGEPDTGQRGLYTRGFRDAESDSNRLSKRTSERSDMVGAPDARKRACPVRGALDGNLLRERNKAPPFDSMSGRYSMPDNHPCDLVSQCFPLTAPFRGMLLTS